MSNKKKIDILLVCDKNSIHTQRYIERMKEYVNLTILDYSGSLNVKDEIHSFPFFSKDASLLSRLIDARKNLHRILKEKKIDIIHIIYLSPIAAFLIHDIALPFIISLMGSDYNVSIIKKYIVNRALQQAFFIVSDSPIIVRELKKKGLRAELIIFGIEDSIITTSKADRVAKYSLDNYYFDIEHRENILKNDIINVISIRHLEPIYNIEMIIEAASIVIEKKPNLFFHFIGDGSLKHRLEKRVERLGLSTRVKFYGFLSHQQTLSLLKKSDIFISIPKQDGLSVSLLEAIALNIPVILSNIAVNRYFIDDGKNGYLVKDRYKLADSIMKLSSNMRLRKIFSESLKNKWIEEIGFKKTIKNYKEKYFSIFFESVKEEFPIPFVCKIYEKHYYDENGIIYFKRKDKSKQNLGIEERIYNPTGYIQTLLRLKDRREKSIDILRYKFYLDKGLPFKCRIPLIYSSYRKDDKIYSGLTIMLGISYLIRAELFNKNINLENDIINLFLLLIEHSLISEIKLSNTKLTEFSVFAAEIINKKESLWDYESADQKSRKIILVKRFLKFCMDNNNGIVINEYPFSSTILNGAMISVICIKEFIYYLSYKGLLYRNEFPALCILNPFLKGIRILLNKSSILFFWSKYDVKYSYPANFYYHSLHIKLLYYFYQHFYIKEFKKYLRIFRIGKLIFPIRYVAYLLWKGRYK